MTRKPEHLAILERREELARMRLEVQRIVRDGFLRAFPDLILPKTTPGTCRRCEHRWSVHNLPRVMQPQWMKPCGCCDRYLRGGPVFR